MKRMTILTVALLCGLLAGAAAADIDDNDKPSVSITPYLGGGFWSDDLGLDDSFVYGGRGAVHLLQWLSLEGTYGRSDATRTADDVDVDLAHLGADLVFDLMPTEKFNPYLAAGWAQLNYDPSDIEHEQYLNGWEAAAGVKIRLCGDNATHRALRVELREVMSPLARNFHNDDKLTYNLVASVGLQFAFGKGSKDSDGDGIRDRDDACSGTPLGALIDERGCPRDSDGDGVYDGLDKCQNTPAGAVVDANGCPLDSDGDGIFDGLDKCEGTPNGAVVDASGCPRDGDGDGVYDGLDKCPDTPSNLQVDREGCPIATTAMEIELLDTGTITTSQIVFKSGSAELDPAHTAVLDEIGQTLAGWSGLEVEVGGHTDSSGSASFNQRLSEQRAQAVLDYLRDHFPDLDTAGFTVIGYGEALPIASNDTAAGKAQNRRVEFKVLNTEALKRQVEKRMMLER